MSGMALLLKTMGFDAEQMQAQAKAFVEYANQQQKYFDDKLNLIIANQKIIADAINNGTRADVIMPKPANPEAPQSNTLQSGTAQFINGEGKH